MLFDVLLFVGGVVVGLGAFYIYFIFLVKKYLGV
jgi:hypothetical protein